MLPTASLEGFPRSASEFEPRSFEMTTYSLYLITCDVFCVHFKVGVSIFNSRLSIPKVNLTGLQNQMFWRLIFLMWETDVRLEPFTLWVEPLQM